MYANKSGHHLLCKRTEYTIPALRRQIREAMPWTSGINKCTAISRRSVIFKTLSFILLGLVKTLSSASLGELVSLTLVRVFLYLAFTIPLNEHCFKQLLPSSAKEHNKSINFYSPRMVDFRVPEPTAYYALDFRSTALG